MTPTSDPPTQLLRPLITAWRGEGSLQVGLDNSAVLLDGVPPQIDDAIQLLTEPHTKAQLAARLPDLDRSWVEWLCAHLGSAKLLATPPRPRGQVLVCGYGPLARDLAAALTLSGVQTRSLPNAEISTFADPDALVVLADHQIEPDRAVTSQLASNQVPHLVVRLEPARGIVGPLVVPGQTACVRCDDLAHCHLDDQWPLLLAQLCTTTATPDAGLLGWAVATAVAQVRAWLDHQPPETLGRCLELDSADFRLRSRSWPMQPTCGCR